MLVVKGDKIGEGGWGMSFGWDRKNWGPLSQQMYDTNTDPSLLKGHTTAPSKFPNFAALSTVVMFPYQEKMFPYQEKYSWGELIRQTNEYLFPLFYRRRMRRRSKRAWGGSWRWMPRSGPLFCLGAWGPSSTEEHSQPSPSSSQKS